MLFQLPNSLTPSTEISSNRDKVHKDSNCPWYNNCAQELNLHVMNSEDRIIFLLFLRLLQFTSVGCVYHCGGRASKCLAKKLQIFISVPRTEEIW